MILAALEAPPLVFTVPLEVIELLAFKAHSCPRDDIAFDPVEGAVHEDSVSHYLLHFCLTIHKNFDGGSDGSV